MIEKKQLALWLFDLGNRLPGITDSDHLDKLRNLASDETFVRCLDAIVEDIGLGHSYGQAVQRRIGLLIPADLRERIISAPAASVDILLREGAFKVLLSLTDREQLQSIFDGAALSYALHRDDGAQDKGPHDIDLLTALTKSASDPTPTGVRVNVSFRFTNDGRLDDVLSYSVGDTLPILGETK